MIQQMLEGIYFDFFKNSYLRKLYAGQEATELDMEQQTGSK